MVAVKDFERTPTCADTANYDRLAFLTDGGERKMFLNTKRVRHLAQRKKLFRAVMPSIDWRQMSR